MKKTYFIYIIIFNLCLGSSFTEKHYHLYNGLPSNYVKTTCQDYRGYIWIGTNQGISRFDGVRFKNYTTITDSVFMGHNYIYDIISDSTGIFISTKKGVAYFDFSTEKFSKFEAFPKNINNVFLYFTKDRKGNIWTNTDRELIQINNKGEILQKIEINKQLPHPFPFNINKFIFDENDNIWALSIKYGLLYFDKENHHFKRYLHNFKYDKSQEKLRVLTIYLDKQNRLWAGTYKNGLYLYDNNKDTFIKIDIINNNENLYLKSLGETISGDLILGTFKSGLFIINTSKKHYNSEFNQVKVLEHFDISNITNITKDIQGNIWVSSVEQGLRIFYNHSKKSIYIIFLFVKERKFRLS